MFASEDIRPRPLSPSQSPQTSGGLLSSQTNESVGAIHSKPRHSRYYIEDQMSVFEVEGTLFKVHRYLLSQESEAFRGMFECPPPPNGIVEGDSEERPITLGDVTMAEFVSLLDYLYERAHSTPAYNLSDQVTAQEQSSPTNSKKKLKRPLRTSPVPSTQSLIDLLSIATRFQCERARKYAISTIDASKSTIEPIAKLLLAQTHNVEHWMQPIFVSLCQRKEPLDVSEASKLDLVTFVSIVKARELVRFKCSTQYGQREPPFEATTTEAAVKEVLAADLLGAS